ncbi:cullin-5-like, partial [Stegodyphus dumicola]|uniref:cullin-5-like n=1 Tax=Stegodyphus dumicola TaxID=202533 RepID=UPI0015A8B390
MVAYVAITKDMKEFGFDQNWCIMKPIMLKVLHQKAVRREEWHELFVLVHNICLWAENGPSSLQKNIEECILKFIRDTQAKVLRHQEDQALLKAYVAEWTKFYTQCDYFPLPLAQLELIMVGSTSIIKKWKKDGPIRKLLLKCWNDSIFSDIKHRLQESAMRLVRAERSGEAFDSQLVIGVKESYVNLGSTTEDKLQIYRDNFEKAYIDATSVFYKEKATEYLEANGIESYMQYADQKLKDEEQRAVKYLDSSSLIVFTENIVKCLVIEYKDIMLAECLRMIKNYETEKLQLMFRLIDKVENGIEPMLKDLESYIISEGLANMMASADIITQDSEKYVAQLLELFRRFSKLVKESFINDPRFLASRDKAFKKIVNDISVFSLELPTKKRTGKTEPESRCPELLANYCDMLLRKTPLSKKLTSDEIEGKLKDVLLILKYVQNKDVFMRYHKSHLTRRLILETSADNEKEENMVNGLRDIGMPADYVNKLSRMFQDIKVNEDLNEEFKGTYHTKNSLADYDSKVLTLHDNMFPTCVQLVHARIHSCLHSWLEQVSNCPTCRVALAQRDNSGAVSDVNRNNILGQDAQGRNPNPTTNHFFHFD